MAAPLAIVAEISQYLLPQGIPAVAIFDDQFRQVFVNAKIAKVSVNPQAKAMEHPLENGATVTDHVIFLPIEIELSVILQSADYKTIYTQLQQAFAAVQIFSIHTRSGIYNNMFLTNIPNSEDPNFFDSLIVALKFKQILIVTAKYGIVPRRAANQPTVSRGQQQPTDVPNLSAARELFIGH